MVSSIEGSVHPNIRIFENELSAISVLKPLRTEVGVKE
jgi:hypothetical protein